MNRDFDSEESKLGEEFEKLVIAEIASVFLGSQSLWGRCSNHVAGPRGSCDDCIRRSQRDGDGAMIGFGRFLFVEVKRKSLKYPDTILINDEQFKMFRGSVRYYIIGEPGNVNVWKSDRVVNACVKMEIDGETKWQFNHTQVKPDYSLQLFLETMKIYN
jgi:hypothetical protein